MNKDKPRKGIFPNLKIPSLFKFDLQIPLLNIHSEVWCDSYERMTKNYLVIWIKFYKWHFGFEIGHTVRGSFSEDNSLDKISERLDPVKQNIKQMANTVTAAKMKSDNFITVKAGTTIAKGQLVTSKDILKNINELR